MLETSHLSNIMAYVTCINEHIHVGCTRIKKKLSFLGTWKQQLRMQYMRRSSLGSVKCERVHKHKAYIVR